MANVKVAFFEKQRIQAARRRIAVLHRVASNDGRFREKCPRGTFNVNVGATERCVARFVTCLRCSEQTFGCRGRT